MKEGVYLLVAILMVGAMLPTAGSSESEKTKGVRRVIGYYFEGHATGNGEYFRKAFHPEAKVLFVREGEFQAWSLDEYIARVATGHPAEDESLRKRRILSLDVTGSTAVAKLELDYPSVTFTDFMSLLNIKGEWRIVNKVFHAETKESQ